MWQRLSASLASVLKARPTTLHGLPNQREGSAPAPEVLFLSVLPSTNFWPHVIVYCTRFSVSLLTGQQSAWRVENTPFPTLRERCSSSQKSRVPLQGGRVSSLLEAAPTLRSRGAVRAAPRKHGSGPPQPSPVPPRPCSPAQGTGGTGRPQHAPSPPPSLGTPRAEVTPRLRRPAQSGSSPLGSSGPALGTRLHQPGEATAAGQSSGQDMPSGWVAQPPRSPPDGLHGEAETRCTLQGKPGCSAWLLEGGRGHRQQASGTGLSVSHGGPLSSKGHSPPYSASLQR